MTAIPIHKPVSYKLFVVLALALTVLFLALPPLSRHAIKNHGANARAVTQRFKHIDPDDDDVWSRTCPDGRVYTIRRLPGGQAFDVSIDTLDGANITRFSCSSKNWVARKIQWCK